MTNVNQCDYYWISLEALELVLSFRKIGKLILALKGAELLITFRSFSHRISHGISSDFVKIFSKSSQVRLFSTRIIKLAHFLPKFK
jgi:hypothetical protein